MNHSQKPTRILLLSGANLNLLGHREPNLYGTQTLAERIKPVVTLAKEHNIEIVHKQSNAEFELINLIHERNMDYIIANFAAFTHTSIALRDALLAVNVPFIEAHITDLAERELFRQHSYFSDIADTVVTGDDCYLRGLKWYLAHKHSK
jgi:3-dehydroquinate dehydratase-2